MRWIFREDSRALEALKGSEFILMMTWGLQINTAVQSLWFLISRYSAALIIAGEIVIEEVLLQIDLELITLIPLLVLILSAALWKKQVDAFYSLNGLYWNRHQRSSSSCSIRSTFEETNSILCNLDPSLHELRIYAGLIFGDLSLKDDLIMWTV